MQAFSGPEERMASSVTFSATGGALERWWLLDCALQLACGFIDSLYYQSPDGQVSLAL